MSDRMIDHRAFTCRKTAVNEYKECLGTLFIMSNQSTLMGVAVNMLQDSCLLKSGIATPDWHVPMFDTHLRKHLWLYCPGHGGVKGNDRVTDWQEKQPSQMACVPEDLKC